MRSLPCAVAFALVLSLAAPGISSAGEERPASIPFADLGSIRNFRPVGDEVLLIEGTNHHWYRATFYAPCIGLRSAEKLAFMTEPGGSLDRFSAIWVEGRRCPFRSFERTEPPAKAEPSKPKS